jgi:hypothetical protein
MCLRSCLRSLCPQIENNLSASSEDEPPSVAIRKVTLQEFVSPVVPPVAEESRPGSRRSSIRRARSSPQVQAQVGRASPFERLRSISAPEKSTPRDDEDAPPLSSHRLRPKSAVDLTPRRPTMSYPARRPLHSTVRQVLPEHFRCALRHYLLCQPSYFP